MKLKKKKYFRTAVQFSVNVPDVSGLCRHRHYLPTPPRVRGHINTQTEERLPINIDLNTLYIYSKSRYLAVLFQVIIRKNGSVVHMTNYRVNRTMSCRIDCPWRGQRKSHSHLVLMYDVPVWFSASALIHVYKRSYPSLRCAYGGRAERPQMVHMNDNTSLIHQIEFRHNLNPCAHPRWLVEWSSTLWSIKFWPSIPK